MDVTAIATISIDGRITPPGEKGTSFSSAETGANFMQLIASVDAVITGRRTFDVVRPMMLFTMEAHPSSIRNIVMTRDPDSHIDSSLPAELEFTSLSPAALLDDLDRRGVRRVAVAGGGEIYAAFAAAGLIDEWIIVIEPVLLGGGTPLFAFAARQDLELAEQRMLNGNTVLLRYRGKTQGKAQP
jgi:dihydrofolate reductase